MFRRFSTRRCVRLAVLTTLLALGVGRAVASPAPEEALPDIPLPSIPDHTFKITDHGAVPDGATLNTDAIRKTVEACSAAGGGHVVIPAGKFLSAAFSLANNVDLHLEKGATLLFSNNPGDYTMRANRYPNLLSAEGCHDISITGEGTIDGQGQPWWADVLKAKGSADAATQPHRPFMVSLHNCTRVLVRGVTLTNSPMFHLVPGGCTDVTIDHVSFIAPADAPNTDACDPSGWHFLITHCTFDVGDDCIAIKATGKAPPGHVSCEDFFVTDCTFKHGHGMSIGGQTPGGLRGLIVRDSTFENTGAGIRMKANRGSGGLVEDCTYEHLTMKNVKEPIFIMSYYPDRNAPKKADGDPGQAVDALTPIWRHIRITDVTSTGSPTAGRIVGLPEMPVSDVVFTNVKIEADKGLDVWNASGIHFVDSRITVKKAPALNLEQATDVIGINPKTGEPEAAQ